MKKFSEFRKKLTAKQAECCALIFSIMLTLIMALTLTLVLWIRLQEASIGLSFLLSIPFFCAIHMLFRCIVFDADWKAVREKHKNAKQRIISELNLTTQSPTKVRYCFERHIATTHEWDLEWDVVMFRRFFNHSEYNFYLQLVNDNGMEGAKLTVTDKDENTVYNYTFYNFYNVEEYFEKMD